MRFRLGPLPGSQDFQPERDGWTRLKEPTIGRQMLIALPAGVVTFFATLLLAIALVGREAAKVNFPWLMVFIVACVPLHEFSHAVFLPGMGLSSKTFFGCWPSKFAFYVYHDAPMSRIRYLTVLVGPVLLLTATPLALCAALDAAPFFVLHLAYANAMASCADIPQLPTILAQVPKDAAIRLQGTETWWIDRFWHS